MDPGFLLLGQDADTSRLLLDRVLRPEVLVFVVAIAAIVSSALVRITRMIIRHRERTAMIEHGYDPESVPPD